LFAANPKAIYRCGFRDEHTTLYAAGFDRGISGAMRESMLPRHCDGVGLLV